MSDINDLINSIIDTQPESSKELLPDTTALPTTQPKLSPISLNADYPIPVHPTWDIWDSTKVTEAKRCMRRVLFHYIMGIQTEHENHDLIFGQATHSALDYLYLHGIHLDNVAGAMEIFNSVYRKHFDEFTDLDYEPKNPAFAELALKSYCRFRKNDEWTVMTIKQPDGTTKPLIEVSGSVPVSNKWKMSYRLDKVMSNEQGHVIVRDHKTAKRDTDVERHSWSSKMQPNLYGHALLCFTDLERYRGIDIDIIFFRKMDLKDDGAKRHMTIPVYRSEELRKGWLWNCLSWLDQIEYNFLLLEQAKVDDDVLKAFPQNETGCTAFYRMCPYYHLCQTSNNPLKYAETELAGFTKRWWNPLNIQGDTVEFHL
jgi:hypothetical protein